jgi:hypothetical protein
MFYLAADVPLINIFLGGSSGGGLDALCDFTEGGGGGCLERSDAFVTLNYEDVVVVLGVTFFWFLLMSIMYVSILNTCSCLFLV